MGAALGESSIWRYICYPLAFLHRKHRTYGATRNCQLKLLALGDVAVKIIYN